MTPTRSAAARRLAILASLLLLVGCGADLAPRSAPGDVRPAVPDQTIQRDEARAEAIAVRLLQSYLGSEQRAQFAAKHKCTLVERAIAPANRNPTTVLTACPGIVRVIERPDTHASTLGGVVRISTGMVKSASDDELAFAIGHELGHILRGHAYAFLRDPFELELEADQIGLAMAAAAGYRAQAAIGLLYRMLGERGTAAVNTTHPSEDVRTRAIMAGLDRLAAAPGGPRTAFIPPR
jgi:predicted Zn-dependent protease